MQDISHSAVRLSPTEAEKLGHTSMSERDINPSTLVTIERTNRFKTSGRWKLPALGIVIAFGVLANHLTAYAASVHKTASDTGPSCLEQYNAKLTDAKVALVKGDRARALASLIDAKGRLARCQERERDSSSGATDLSFNLAPLSAARTS